MSSQSSSTVFSGHHGSVGSTSSQMKICRSWPPPEQWTKVKELNVENREPCEIWRSGINQQLAAMRENMKACGEVINNLEKSLACDHAVLKDHSGLSVETSTTDDQNCQIKSSLGTQTD